MKVGFTKGALSLIDMYAKNDEEVRRYCIRQLGDTVVNIRRTPGLDVDTSDNAITFAGVPLSFVRDWTRGESIVMTTTEAKALDMEREPVTFILNL